MKNIDALSEATLLNSFCMNMTMPKTPVPCRQKDQAEVSLICADACNVLTKDERVNIVRALVCFYRFEVHHVAHDGVVIGDSVCAEDVAGEPGTFKRHPYVVALGHGDVLVAGFARILEAAYVKREQLSLCNLAGHPNKFLLHELVAGDRLIAELLAGLRIL